MPKNKKNCSCNAYKLRNAFDIAMTTIKSPKRCKYQYDTWLHKSTGRTVGTTTNYTRPVPGVNIGEALAEWMAPSGQNYFAKRRKPGRNQNPYFILSNFHKS